MIRRKSKTKQTTGEQLADLDEPSDSASAFPGPSPNPATNLLIADVVFRGAAMLFRRAAEQRLLHARVSPAAARRVLGGRTMGKGLATYAATKLATRSIPGLLVVGGGLIAKTLFDRRAAHRSARRKARESASLRPADEQAGD